MKLAALILASLLALPTMARAEEADYSQAAPAQRHKNKQLKQALMQQFDRDGDGRLGPEERRKAIRVLARIQHKLAGRDAQLRPKIRRFIQRFDTNGDGNVHR